MKTTLTTCGYCGCGCNFYLKTENNKIIGVLPKRDHPVSRGMLCSKGWQGHDFVHQPDRLTTPLLRQKNGRFKKITWDVAYAVLAKQFQEIIKEHGPDCFALLSSARCTNEENYLATKLTRAIIKSPNIDHCARL